MRPRIRLLGTLAAVAALAAVVRAGDVLDAAFGRPAVAQGAPAQGSVPQNANQQASPGDKPGAQVPSTQAQSAQADAPKSEAPKGDAAKAEPGAVPPMRGDVASLTESEVEVLQGLVARREALEVRGRELDMREATIKAAEARLVQRIKDLEQIRSTVEAKLKQQETVEEGRLKSLVKVYETMKPKDAARIMEQLDTPVLLDMLERMKEPKIAPILAAMEPAKAKSVTAELALRRQVIRPRG